MNSITLQIVKKINHILPKIVTAIFILLLCVAVIAIVIAGKHFYTQISVFWFRFWLIALVINIVVYAIAPYFMKRFEEIGFVTIDEQNIYVSMLGEEQIFPTSKVHHFKFYYNETAADPRSTGLGNRDGINNYINFTFDGKEYVYQVFVKNHTWLKQFDIFAHRFYHGKLDLYRSGKKVKKLLDHL